MDLISVRSTANRRLPVTGTEKVTGNSEKSSIHDSHLSGVGMNSSCKYKYVL